MSAVPKTTPEQSENESSHLAMIRSAVHRALVRIGKSNGHACPTTDPNDELSHKLLVAQEGMRFFDNLKKEALEEIAEAYGDRIVNVDPGTVGAVSYGNLYMLLLQVKHAAERLDTKKFITELTRLGVGKGTIEEARENATTKNKPAQIFTVVERC
ncbi:hypothetical protein HC928_05050 [bacterium]|nr:hypothetical protein [bacterium]